MSDPFQMLPEWAEQSAVMLAWPHERSDWKPWLTDIEQDYVALASAIADSANPLILCRDHHHQARIEQLIGGCCQHPPQFYIRSYNDTWCRDFGPLALGHRNDLVLMDFRFNGWGDKYNAELDNAINSSLKAVWQVPMRSVDFELEGGSIECDGLGTLLTTEHCLLDSNRNHHLDRNTIEHLIKDKLGVSRVLWLSAGALLGDDTDSHIDNLARFCDPRTIAFASCNNPEDPHFPHLQEMERQLKKFRQLDGSPYILVPIEIPAPQLDESGQRLPGSYVNFLILNQQIIVPVFGCEQDEAALTSLRRCFPDKKIRPVRGNNLIRQFGGPHCATMQLPKGVIAL
ncbi:MAG: agmatine deiminase family protein [Ketobacter sp.]